MNPLTGGRLYAGSLALALATFMNVLDLSIANVSIPAISGDLGVSPDQGTWVITSFAVANAISLPLTGWLTQRYGQVRLFTLSVLLFVVASLACGLAPSLGWLIVARVIQGAVAGPMIPLSQALLLSSFPKERKGAALALWSMTTLVAPVMGPLLGGWISDNATWPWIFPMNHHHEITRFKGFAALNLKLPAMALPALTDGLEQLGPVPTKRRAYTMSKLAEAHCQTGDVEQACDLGTQAFVIGSQLEDPWSLMAVRDLRVQLMPMEATPAVRAFDERVASTLLALPSSS